MKVNEDTVLDVDEDAPLFAVADGTGGTFASTLVMDLLRQRRDDVAELATRIAEREEGTEARLAMSQFFDTLFNEASISIHQGKQAFGGRQVASTVVAAAVVDRFAYVANVGNSRAYLWRDNKLSCVTTDHTLAAAQLQSGEISAEEFKRSPFRKALTQALGLTPKVSVDVAEVRIADGDRLLLCTDGLTHCVPEQTMADLMALDDAEATAERLVARALDNGGNDNISVAVVHLAGEEKAFTATGAVFVDFERVFLFKPLNHTERLVVAPYLAEHTFAADEVISREGDIGNAMFMIASGEVDVTRAGVKLATLGPGTAFGGLALARRGRRTATAKTLTETHTFILSRERFRELVQRRPDIGIRMLLALLDSLGDRLDDLSARIGRIDGKGDTESEQA